MPVMLPPSIGAETTAKTVVLVSDAGVPTGFARVGEEILKGLSRQSSAELRLHQIGINYSGAPHPHNWPVHPASAAGDDLKARVSSLAAQVKPDVIILLNDAWVVAEVAADLETAGYTGAIVGYCPVDGAPLPLSAADGLSNLRSLVAYTEFGRQAFIDLFDTADVTPPALDVIPHGVDTGAFGLLIPDDPAASRKAAKAQLFPADPKFQDSFVVFNGNRNQPRKRIDVTMRAFADFARDKKPNVMLYLHMAKIDFGWNVVELATRFGITDRLIMSSTENALPSLSEKQLNLMYNACDVGLNTSAAEGWGLVSFEHAAAGAAQIVPGTETQKELWGGVAKIVEPCMTTTAIGQVADWHLVSEHAVSEALEEMYRDKQALESCADRCRRHASAAHFSWKNIGDRWTCLVESLC